MAVGFRRSDVLPLFEAFVRPHLGYCVRVETVSGKKYEKLEQIQRVFTCWAGRLMHTGYEN